MTASGVEGVVAGLVVGGGNILMYLIWGVLGSFVGGFLFSALKINLGIRNAIVNQIVTSFRTALPPSAARSTEVTAQCIFSGRPAGVRP